MIKRIKKCINNENGSGMTLFVIFLGFVLTFSTLVLLIAMNAGDLGRNSKYVLNSSVKAASMWYDEELVSEGIPAIDKDKALDAFYKMLDKNNYSKYEVLEIAVINRNDDLTYQESFTYDFKGKKWIPRIGSCEEYVSTVPGVLEKRPIKKSTFIATVRFTKEIGVKNTHSLIRMASSQLRLNVKK